MRHSRVLLACPHIKELSMMVHTHPTLCEVLDEAFKGAERMRKNRHVEQKMLGVNAAICRLIMLYYMGNLYI